MSFVVRSPPWNDGEAPDQDVAGPGLLERTTDAADVFDGWRADLWDISLLSHAWASSKLVNRKRPRGASPRVPRRAHAVRSKASALRGVAAASRRFPTTLEGSTSISRSRRTRTSLYPDAGPVQRFLLLLAAAAREGRERRAILP